MHEKTVYLYVLSFQTDNLRHRLKNEKDFNESTGLITVRFILLNLIVLIRIGSLSRNTVTKWVFDVPCRTKIHQFPKSSVEYDWPKSVLYSSLAFESAFLELFQTIKASMGWICTASKCIYTISPITRFTPF
jgi:hypothetical protein